MANNQQPTPTGMQTSQTGASPEKPSVGKKSKIATILVILVVIILVVVLAIIFVGKSKKESGGTSSTNQTSGEKSAITLKDYPSQVVPLYPNATAISNVSGPQNDKKYVNVVLESKDQPTTINDFYQKFLNDNGWQVKSSEYGGGDLKQLEFSKGESNGQINIKSSSENKEQTEITIILNIKE